MSVDFGKVGLATLRNRDQMTPSSGDMNSSSSRDQLMDVPIDHKRSRYPFCVVWTPIPLLTWLLPFVGHMGIAMSTGIIRDFAGPYVVTEDNMAFGKPTKYWRLKPQLARGGSSGWDNAVFEASEVYKTRMHNLLCDNCHSHVAMALNLMKYNGKTNWNMVKLAFLMLVYGRYVSIAAWLKTWLPFFFVILVCSLAAYFLN